MRWARQSGRQRLGSADNARPAGCAGALRSRCVPKPAAGSLGEFLQGGDAQVRQRFPVLSRNAVAVGPTLRGRLMQVETLTGQISEEVRGAVGLNNLAVRSHDRQDDDNLC